MTSEILSSRTTIISFSLNGNIKIKSLYTCIKKIRRDKFLKRHILLGNLGENDRAFLHILQKYIIHFFRPRQSFYVINEAVHKHNFK